MSRKPNPDTEQSELRGYTDGTKFNAFTVETLKAFTAHACENYGDAAYLRGLGNGANMPAKKLARLAIEQPAWYEKSQVSVSEMLKYAEVAAVKDETWRNKLYETVTGDVSITYRDVQDLAKPHRAAKPKPVCATCERVHALLEKWAMLQLGSRDSLNLGECYDQLRAELSGKAVTP